MVLHSHRWEDLLEVWVRRGKRKYGVRGGKKEGYKNGGNKGGKRNSGGSKIDKLALKDDEDDIKMLVEMNGADDRVEGGVRV